MPPALILRLLRRHCKVQKIIARARGKKVWMRGGIGAEPLSL